MSMTLKKVLIGAVALVAVGGLVAACGDDEEAPAGGTVVNVTSNDDGKWDFVLDKTTVPAGEVTFELTNKGTLEHELLVYAQQDISPLLTEKVAAVKAGQTLSISSRIQGLVEDAAGEHELEVKPGESGTFTVNLTPGTYELGCIIVETIGAETIDHHGKGMKATLTVK
ncbi:MAG: hypothetical protein Q8P22_14540 [Chloroflexota bacterium]|nr:hypothetical protein [Chloroflexota bacterium]